MRLEQAIPVLPSLNLERTVAFYRDKLGFRALFVLPDAASMVKDAVEIHFWPSPDPELPKVSSCRIVVRGIKALYETYQRAGVIHPNGALKDQPWGYREFVALDLDGNALRFAEDLNPGLG